MTDRRRTSDALSLTLPVAKSRARSRRRKRPPGWFWAWLAIMILYAIIAGVAFCTGDPIFGVCNLFGVGVYWNLAMRANAGRSTVSMFPWQIAAILMTFAGVLAR